MWRIFFVIILFSVFQNQTAQGQNWKYNHQTTIQPSFGVYFQSLENSNRTIPEISAQQEFEARYKTKFKTFVALRSVLNTDEKQRRRLWLNQAYLAFNKKNFYGKIGKQIVKWGDLTGWSAMDMANVYDYYDFLRTDDEVLGSWAIDAKLSLKKWQFQLRVIPFKNYSRLYFENNRWIRLPHNFRGPNDLIFTAEFNELKKESPNSSISYGANVSYENDDFEISFNGYSGTNDIPQRLPQLSVPNLTNKVIPYDIGLMYHRLNIASVTFSKLIGEYSLWSELSYVNNQRVNDVAELSSDNYWGFTVGLDRVFIFENPEKQLKILLQYLKNFTKSDVEYTVNDLDHVLDHALLADATYQFNYKWKIAARSVSNLSSFSQNISTSLNYKVTDQFNLSCQADFLFGQADHFFGYYQDNSRLFITLKYHL